MKKPRYKRAPNGRKAWPRIFVYVTKDKTRHGCPPPREEAYTLDIIDPDAYEELRASGALYGAAHWGVRSELIDRSPTA